MKDLENALCKSLIEARGGRRLESISGDKLWQTREPINITKLAQSVAGLSIMLRKREEHTIDFMKTWVKRVNNKQTTPEAFINVVSHHPSFKEKPTPPKKEQSDD